MAKREKTANEKYVKNAIDKFAKRYRACKTEEERKRFLESLTEEEKREIRNARTYIELKALCAYSAMTPEQRNELKEGLKKHA